MSAVLKEPVAADQNAVAAKPKPLPRPEGDRRMQNALDDDRYYQSYILAAFLVAVAAGSGFGRLSGAAAALWSLAVAGLAARCIGPGGGWQRGSTDAGASRKAAVRLAGLAIGSAVLASLRGGPQVFVVAGAVSVVAVTVLAATYAGAKANIVFALLLIVAGGGLPWIAASQARSPWLESIGFGVIAAIVHLSSLRLDGSMNPALATTRLAGIAYALFVWRWPAQAPALGAMAAAVVVTALDVLTSRRWPFAAIAAAVFVAHLGALPPAATMPRPELYLHVVAATLEFLLLILAGFRHVQASLWKLPYATYRIAPLCIVPRIDRAWDHPVKINVV